MNMAAPQLSLITTCKGRLHHLQESLPRMLAQPDCECIVVDYDCPDGTADWVAAHHPQVRLVQADPAPLFKLGHARNLGAAVATAPWLAFIDADTLLAASYAEEIVPQLLAGRYYRPVPRQDDLWGCVVCHKSDFDTIGGYDELMCGWGGEDDDLYQRLAFLGCKAADYPGALLSSIAHDSSARVRFSDIEDRWVNQRTHALYCRIKHDLMRQAGQFVLPIEIRQGVYEEVRRTVVADAAQGVTSSQITVQLPAESGIPLWGWTIRRSWVFTLEKLPNATPSPP